MGLLYPADRSLRQLCGVLESYSAFVEEIENHDFLFSFLLCYSVGFMLTLIRWLKGFLEHHNHAPIVAKITSLTIVFTLP